MENKMYGCGAEQTCFECYPKVYACGFCNTQYDKPVDRKAGEVEGVCPECDFDHTLTY